MNSAAYVDEMIANLKGQVASGEIPLSEAAWQAGLACLGWPYVFGAWGAKCTVSERQYRLRLNPAKTTIQTKCKAFDGGSCSGCQWFPGGERVRCFDCRGFTDWLLKQFGFDLEGEGATSQWNTAKNWCAKGLVEDGIPQGVLVNIFIRTGTSTMSHTGYYYNGATLECSSGVQHNATMKKNRWTHWAVAACFADVIGGTAPAAPAKEAPVASTVKTLRKGSKGEAVKKLQQRLMELGYTLPKYGADGDYGNETLAAVKAFQKDWGLKVDGIAGPETQKIMETAVAKEPAKKTYKVTVSGLPEEVAREIVTRYGGTMMAEG